MIDHVWTVLCSRAVIDQESNNISIQNAIEQVTIVGEPKPDGFLPADMEVVTLWARADPNVPAEGRERLTFLSPSKENLLSDENIIDLTAAKRHRWRWKLNGLPVREAGGHVFQVELQCNSESEWRVVASIPLEIVFKPPKMEQEPNEA